MHKEYCAIKGGHRAKHQSHPSALQSIIAPTPLPVGVSATRGLWNLCMIGFILDKWKANSYTHLSNEVECAWGSDQAVSAYSSDRVLTQLAQATWSCSRGEWQNGQFNTSLSSSMLIVWNTGDEGGDDLANSLYIERDGEGCSIFISIIKNEMKNIQDAYVGQIAFQALTGLQSLNRPCHKIRVLAWHVTLALRARRGIPQSWHPHFQHRALLLLILSLFLNTR